MTTTHSPPRRTAWDAKRIPVLRVRFLNRNESAISFSGRFGAAIRCVALLVFQAPATPAQVVPLVDYHLHLFSPAIVELSSTASSSSRLPPISANDLVAQLEAAGIRRGLVLSVAYMYGNPNKPPVENEYARVKAENDWTAQQVAQFPNRLRAFCSFNPLKDYALDELARCAKDPQLHYGLKLHFGNSDVQLDDAQHIAQLRRVFRAANDYRMPIVVHLHPSITTGRSWGRDQVRSFLNEVLSQTPDIPVQIAHLSSAGRYDDGSDQAMAVFAEAIAKRDPRAMRLYFDVSGIAGLEIPEAANLMAVRIREIGVARILYGTDGSADRLASRKGWAAFRQLPLSDDEFRVIADNVATYMR